MNNYMLEDSVFHDTFNKILLGKYGEAPKRRLIEYAFHSYNGQKRSNLTPSASLKSYYLKFADGFSVRIIKLIEEYHDVNWKKR